MYFWPAGCPSFLYSCLNFPLSPPRGLGESKSTAESENSPRGWIYSNLIWFSGQRKLNFPSLHKKHIILQSNISWMQTPLVHWATRFCCWPFPWHPSSVRAHELPFSEQRCRTIQHLHILAKWVVCPSWNLQASSKSSAVLLGRYSSLSSPCQPTDIITSEIHILAHWRHAKRNGN